MTTLRTAVALLALLHAAATAAAQAPTEQLLWPNGAPGALGAAPKDQPRLLVWRAPRSDAATPAVVVCPGGGYGHLAMDHEGKQIAAWLNSIGVTAAVLDYRHRGKGYGHPAPLQDAQRALRTVRANAEAWRIDPARTGVLGFSAGGHLASSVSVHHDAGEAEHVDPVERHSCRPDFSVLCYAVLAFDQQFTHKGSQRNLLGEDPPAALVAEMSSERQVDERTPPAFLWHTTADRAVPVENSLAYYAALRRAGVPCELHCFERGRHGVGLGKKLAASAWPKLCQRWLVARGVLRE
ncbi:MAG: alpha/beta hydrolase [Planctomycetota bacterium]|nr:alpha/beta hydrolase [Planctomycetota bacterium]